MSNEIAEKKKKKKFEIKLMTKSLGADGTFFNFNDIEYLRMVAIVKSVVNVLDEDATVINLKLPDFTLSPFSYDIDTFSALLDSVMKSLRENLANSVYAKKYAVICSQFEVICTNVPQKVVNEVACIPNFLNLINDQNMDAVVILTKSVFSFIQTLESNIESQP